jgi:hypothetical protein
LEKPVGVDYIWDKREWNRRFWNLRNCFIGCYYLGLPSNGFVTICFAQFVGIVYIPLSFIEHY